MEMFSMKSNSANAFDDQMLTPISSPLKMTSPKHSPKIGDKSGQDCRGISSSVTILRPRSPTKCSTDVNGGLMEFVERAIKDSFNSGVPCPWEDIICAFSATFLFRSSSGSFIPDVDMQMYWCNFCTFKSKEKREMITHSMSHRFKCNYCDQECFTRFDVVKHSIRTHPEYRLTRNALKACMLLRDLLEQDETSIMFGGKNLDSDEKSENFHIEYDQQSTNSNHGSNSGGADFQNSLGNQNAQASIKSTASFSMFPSSKSKFNDKKDDAGLTTLPLEMSGSEPLIELVPSLDESNNNGTNPSLIEFPSSESDKQNADNGPIALITDVQSHAVSLENKANSLQHLITSTDETELQIVDVQSTNSFPANIVTLSPVEENETQKIDSQAQASISQPSETIQLLENLRNPNETSENKETPDTRVSEHNVPFTLSVEGKSDNSNPAQTLKRKTTALTLESSAEEDEDDDPNYEPEQEQKPSKLLRLTRNKKKSKSPTKEASVEKKQKSFENIDVHDLPVGSQFYRCNYCTYNSSKKRKVEAHIKQKHVNKKLKYVRMTINSDGDIVPYLVGGKSEQKNQAVDIKPSCSPTPIKTDDNDVNDKGTPDKYACMFCNYKSADVQIIRQHMFRLHPSKKFCCIDNLLKQKGKSFYTFFCCRHKCSFLSVEPQKYIDHVEKCTPLPKSGNEDANKPTGLQQSVTFAQSLQDSEKVDGNRVSKKEFVEARDYSCHRCSFSAVGNENMKSHMLSEHPNLSMIALVKKSDSTLDFYLFCPEENCQFVTQKKHELDIHRKQTHTDKSNSIEDEDNDIKPFGDQKDGDPIEKNTMTYMPAYECLYCESSCISTSLMNMKRHVQETHPNEVIIVRDCVAYKRKRPSRIYVCETSGCIFNDLDYKEYLTHSIAHKGGTMYGCANCNWVSRDKKDFNDHIKRQKGIKHFLTETNIVMKEDGSIMVKNHSVVNDDM